MQLFVGLTDYDWYSYLSDKNFDEVNFWRPGTTTFKSLQPGELFLFKLKKPHLAIVGGGFFVKYSLFPIDFAWEAFRDKNGTSDFESFSKRLKSYRHRNNIDQALSDVGCIVLTEPFFFKEEDWIRPPEDWKNSIVIGKHYDGDQYEVSRIYQEIQDRMRKKKEDNYFLKEENNRYTTVLTKMRLGQGGFRVLVTDTYNRKCAISGEKTLPVLQAAHIMPYSNEGPHDIQNGILMRSDIHTLFDKGYITISPDLYIEVSNRLKDDFGNGKIYYQYHGTVLKEQPIERINLPARKYLEWHNHNIYLG